MIIPALFSHSKEEFTRKLSTVENAVSLVQIDIEDGVFIPTTSWADPTFIGTIKTPVQFELHLMVQNPIDHLKQWSGVQQVMRATAHIEATENPREFIEACRALGWSAGLALKPETPIEAASPYFDLIDVLLVLGVPPGPSGQTLIPETFEKIKKAASLPSHPLIEIDGGVNSENIQKFRQAGCDLFGAGGAIFNAPNPVLALQDLQQKISS